jgi:hypothetical protein
VSVQFTELTGKFLQKLKPRLQAAFRATPPKTQSNIPKWQEKFFLNWISHGEIANGPVSCTSSLLLQDIQNQKLTSQAGLKISRGF